ncbi:MAG: hypothetical protein JWM07_550 [Candidatus Saccharibacteria bacterium]|nr:hypothetical protein [Candidatus Saccharibacteria bacterium]
MEQYSQKQLDSKINAFIAKKTEQYPELMQVKKVNHGRLHSHFSSAPVISSMRALKPQLLG